MEVVIEMEFGYRNHGRFDGGIGDKQGDGWEDVHLSIEAKEVDDSQTSEKSNGAMARDLSPVPLFSSLKWIWRQARVHAALSRGISKSQIPQSSMGSNIFNLTEKKGHHLSKELRETDEFSRISILSLFIQLKLDMPRMHNPENLKILCHCC